MNCIFSLFVTLAFASCVAAKPAYFIVGNGNALLRDLGTYVLPIEDPIQIAEAREELAAGSPHAVLAEWAAGPDGINRDHFVVGAPPWSWHVTRFIAFVGDATNNMRGSPILLETNPNSFVTDQGRLIAFPGFRLLSEIVSTFKVSVEYNGGAATFAWRKLGKEYSYRLEYRDTANENEWKQIPGAPNPISTNSVTLVDPPGGYYRVVAVLLPY